MTTYSRTLSIPKQKIDTYSCCLAELRKTTYKITIKNIYELITISLSIPIKNNGAQSLPNTIKFVNLNSNKIKFKEGFITFPGEIEKNIVFNISIELVFPNDISPGQYIINSKLDLAYLGIHHGFTFFIDVLDSSYDDKLKKNFIKQNQYDILFRNKEKEKLSSNNLNVLKNEKSKYENLENERGGRAIIDKDDKGNIESTLFNKSTTLTQLTKGDEATKPKINPINDSHLAFLNKNNNSRLYNNKNTEIIQNLFNEKQNLVKNNAQLKEEKEKLIQENEKLSKDNKIQKKLLEKANNLRQTLEKEIKRCENLSGLIVNYKNKIEEKNTLNNEMNQKINELTQNIKILTDENEKLKKDKANSNDSINFQIQFEEIKTKLIEAEKTIKMMNDEKENLNKIIQSYQNQQQNLKSDENKTLKEMNDDINISNYFDNKSEKELFHEKPTEDNDILVNKILNDLNDKYNITSIFEISEIKDAIIKSKGDEDKMIELLFT